MFSVSDPKGDWIWLGEELVQTQKPFRKKCDHMSLYRQISKQAAEMLVL